MSVFVPDFYPQFHCIADRCRHSCCIGWEIDVDEAALKRYQQVEGPLGKKLAQCIATEDTEDGPTSHFMLEGEAERCPFLNERNLCELILNLGEDSLCNICRDHPRFRNFYSDRVELGLGLCCEEAARIVLTQQSPFQLIPLEPVTSSEVVTQEESQFFAFRNMLFQILANTRADWTLRVNQICDAIDVPMPTFDPAEWGTFLLTLERLDPTWDDELTRLIQSGASTNQASDNENSDDVLFAFRHYMHDQGRTEEYIHLLEYFLFRHLNTAPDEMTARVLFGVLAVSIIEWMGAAHYHEASTFTLADQIELVRMFSSEIEYSDENVDCILEELMDRFL
ncbi:MAG: flagellin lysine-N-methylase [Clostridiales bacterium]|nr:flagellin lysine-N-methylase [Candidatus Scatonaster coprocaballi]